jgi:hypothetical protein
MRVLFVRLIVPDVLVLLTGALGCLPDLLELNACVRVF